LSVGSLLAVSAVGFALATMPFGMGPAASMALVLAGATALGAVNGALVAWARIPPFIVTLAMMAFARGLAKALAGGRKVTQHVLDEGGGSHTVPRPPVFDAIDSRILGDNVSIVTLIMLACVALTWTLLARLEAGRHLYAVGGNAEAARLSGVP